MHPGRKTSWSPDGIYYRQVHFTESFAGGEQYWTVFLEYEPILEHEQRRSALTEAGQACYDRLREWRRETAEQEGIPPFVIARNSDLTEIVQKEVVTLEALKQMRGFGRKKVEKYGEAIIAILTV